MTAQPRAIGGQPDKPGDPRRAASVVAGVLHASGAFTQPELDVANRGLAALGRPPLVQQDFVAESPEQLAGLIPRELREPLLALLYQVAGDEPIRRRIADAYAGLWHTEAEPPAPLRSGGSPVLRALIGTLPQHHVGKAVQEDDMQQQQQAPYRDGAAQQQPVERSPLRARVERIRDEYHRVVEAVEKVIVGKRDVIERVLGAMAARGHVLLVDVPGVGKTQLCKALAAVIESRFNRIQFTPDLLPMDITGANVFDMRDKQFVFRPGPVFTHILLADEINRATPKTQSALLEVMEERCVTVDGVTHHLEEPFQVLATMNPIDHQGTYALPAAQVDRFMVMLEIGFPAPDDEVKVLDFHLGAQSPLATLRPVISRAQFNVWRDTVPMIHVTPEIKRMAVDIVNGLRKSSDEGVSVSPRATLAWVRAAQARAMLAGREFVAAEDLNEVAPDVLRHRLGMDRAAVRERLRTLGARR
nr:AAA family ATPase [Kofleriaceae bacterium]